MSVWKADLSDDKEIAKINFDRLRDNLDELGSESKTFVTALAKHAGLNLDNNEDLLNVLESVSVISRNGTTGDFDNFGMCANTRKFFDNNPDIRETICSELYNDCLFDYAKEDDVRDWLKDALFIDSEMRDEIEYIKDFIDYNIESKGDNLDALKETLFSVKERIDRLDTLGTAKDILVCNYVDTQANAIYEQLNCDFYDSEEEDYENRLN